MMTVKKRCGVGSKTVCMIELGKASKLTLGSKGYHVEPFRTNKPAPSN